MKFSQVETMHIYMYFGLKILSYGAMSATNVKTPFLPHPHCIPSVETLQSAFELLALCTV